jgi:Uma2 family endonuclease
LTQRDLSDHPRPGDVFLVVGVSETAYRLDRRDKMRLYLAAGVSEFWIVNIRAAHVELYRKPSGDAYQETRIAARGKSISPIAFPDVAVPVDRVIPLTV